MSTSIGFCITLLPFLSVNLEFFFGRDHFIRRIPESELSTPEDYLESTTTHPQAPSPRQIHRSAKDGSNETIFEEGEEDGDGSDEVDTEAPPVNEETPLLSDEKS